MFQNGAREVDRRDICRQYPTFLAVTEVYLRSVIVQTLEIGPFHILYIKLTFVPPVPVSDPHTLLRPNTRQLKL